MVARRVVAVALQETVAQLAAVVDVATWPAAIWAELPAGRDGWVRVVQGASRVRVPPVASKARAVADGVAAGVVARVVQVVWGILAAARVQTAALAVVP